MNILVFSMIINSYTKKKRKIRKENKYARNKMLKSPNCPHFCTHNLNILSCVIIILDIREIIKFSR